MPTPLIWTTDPHLDHAGREARERFLLAMRETPGKAVILTGDISTSTSLAADLEAIAEAAGRPVYHVLGNHDHYGASVEEIRDKVVSLSKRRPEIRWLPPAGVVPIADDLVLVGVDGWADGRHGDPITTPLRLNDDRLIAEIAGQPGRAARLAVKQALADADAARLATLLERAAALADRIIVATHVPPFLESLPLSGPLSRPEWPPLLVCRATGEVLRAFAADHPAHTILVLAGHTHAPTDILIAPNLRCRVGAARYGHPTVVPIAA